ncbi:hypothetical protein PH552_12305 [Rhizobium sp. CNPSo 3968]|uniref:hypothetical protein n=1 Tax=Rhizobium sp. CNPSo 3968 TaxID=3021408 RepID=UPI00254BCD04|nr:hypothetical protein [Rhizobium sp. CNPSo 3968]MDK4720126.1 hypothetical protein [Rhizobium sp. CNPSo 3968]
MKVTNTSKALQGINTLQGVKYLEPGKSADAEFSESGLAQAKRLPFLSIEDDAGEPVDGGLDRDDLKKQAAELGLEYPRNITTEKLKELIDTKLAS